MTFTIDAQRKIGRKACQSLRLFAIVPREGSIRNERENRGEETV